MAVAPDGFSDVGGLDGTALGLHATGCCTLHGGIERQGREGWGDGERDERGVEREG